MKKVINLLLICSVVTIASTNVTFAKSKNTQVIAKKPEKIQIVKPEKNKKVNKRLEKRKNAENAKSKVESSKEAEGMYETKFPTINSKIEYADMNGEVTLSDCIKLAITHNPTIMSAISNSEIYKSRIGQAWSNYFPTLSAGVNYSRNDMFMTMANSYMSSMNQRYNMYYMPTLSADMLLFDFGKTKAMADMAKRNFESSRYDAETSIELVIYNVKVAYYNLLFAEIQKSVYEDTVKDFELQLKQASAHYHIGKKAKIDVTTAEYNLGNAKVNLIKAKNTLELGAAQLANAVGIPELEGVASLIKAYGKSNWEVELNKFLLENKSLKEEMEHRRNLQKIPVALPSGENIELSFGEHNVLQKEIVENFLTKFGFNSQVLYVGDTTNKFLCKDDKKLKELKCFNLKHEELPDVIAYSKDKNLLFLCEAVHSAGPMSEIRVRRLKEQLNECTADIIFITAFLTKKDFKKWILDIAWETEVWIAETPEHMVHFNVYKFLELH